MTDRMDEMMAKVSALLAVADDPATPPEAAVTYRERAEALMFKYKIDSLVEPETFSAVKPVFHTVTICRTTSEYTMTYRILARYMAEHVGARVAFETTREDDAYVIQAIFAGYESDVRYAEMLFMSAALAFRGKMEPGVDRTKSDAYNCFVLRQAGWEGRRIALELWGVNDKATRSKARRLADAEATRQGESTEGLSGLGTNVKTFRQQYIDGFLLGLWDRLSRLRMTRGETEHGLVLANAAERIDEMFYERFPYMRPSKDVQPYVDPRDTCPRCKASKQGECREHYIPRGRSSRGARYNIAGAARGRMAAASVDLGPSGTGRLDTNSRHNALEG